MAKKTKPLKFFLIFTLAVSLFSGCSQKEENRIVIWTDNSDLVQYIELFNATHDTKAVLVYKSNPAASLPPEQGELKPDLVIGSYLKNENTRKYFEPIDYLFDRKYLHFSDFYSRLLQSGEIFYNYYLLPVSFNLPAIIFSTENKSFVTGNYTISPDELFESGKKFNQRNKKKVLTRIGFSPLSNDNFLYTVARMNGVQFKESKKNYFTYIPEKLDSTIKYLTKMTLGDDSSVQESYDFVYKYLSVVDTKRVTNGRSLFAFTTSNRLFKLPAEQLSKIDFRWLSTTDGQIPVDDSMIMMGISRYASNYSGCTEFITWFFNSATQKEFLEMKKDLTSDLINFGVTGGFSSIKEVNEHILPVYYTTLLSDIPQENTLKVPDPKPVRWEMVKNEVIIPYIKDSILNAPVQVKSDEKPAATAPATATPASAPAAGGTDQTESEEEKTYIPHITIKSMEERFSDWQKQNQNVN